MSTISARSRVRKALATAVAVAAIVVASVIGLDGWADQAATHDVAAVTAPAQAPTA